MIMRRILQLRVLYSGHLFSKTPMLAHWGNVTQRYLETSRVRRLDWQTEEGWGKSKPAAKLQATLQYVDSLQKQGLMQVPPPTQVLKRKREDSVPAPVKRPAHTVSLHAPPVLLHPIRPGLVPTELLVAASQVRRPAGDGPVSKLVELLRVGLAERAAQTLRGMAASTITVKQLAKLVDSFGLRTREAAALEVLNVIDAQQMALFPSAPGKAYFGRFARWAVRDFISDAQSAINQARTLPAFLLERNGACIQHLQINAGSKASQLLVRPVGVSSGWSHNFQKGDWLLLTSPHTATPSECSEKERPGEICCEVEVVSTAWDSNSLELRIVGESPAAAANKVRGRSCRLDRIANHVTLSRQIEALHRLCKVDDIEQPLQIQWTPQLLASAMHGAAKDKGQDSAATWITRLLLNADSGSQPGMEAVIASEPSTLTRLIPGQSLLLEANESQRQALTMAYSRRLTLIQGPPGTGKTTTALLLVRSWLQSGFRPVLCSADSNIAVDNLVDGCAKASLNVVRIGRPEATRADLEQYNLLQMASGIGPGGFDPQLQYSQMKGVLAGADVVCATCAGSDHPVLEKMSFARVLLDEAGQATELSTLVPLMKMKAESAVAFVGDHRQLPPSVSNIEVDVEGFGTSLFERLAVQGVEPHLLNIQYRMHPCIAFYPSLAYYSGQIRSGVSGSRRQPPQGISWPLAEAPISFLPVLGREFSEGTSYTNHAEVEALKEVLLSLLRWEDVRPEDVGVITPYAAQARAIRKLLGCPPPGKRLVTAQGVAAVEVSSVDGFQGREKDRVAMCPAFGPPCTSN